MYDPLDPDPLYNYGSENKSLGTEALATFLGIVIFVVLPGLAIGLACALARGCIGPVEL